MKIYTKSGDKGTTSLIGGKRVPKHHIRIEAYGTIDELTSWIGLIRDYEIDENTKSILIKIQNHLMICASLLATELDERLNNLPQLYNDDIELLEKEIDKMEQNLEPLKMFILPGGNKIVSFCHITRTVCRRAERIIIELSEIEEISDLVIKYLNRLSDFLFVLSRKFAKDFDAEETAWK